MHWQDMNELTDLMRAARFGGLERRIKAGEARAEKLKKALKEMGGMLSAARDKADRLKLERDRYKAENQQLREALGLLERCGYAPSPMRTAPSTQGGEGE